MLLSNKKNQSAYCMAPFLQRNKTNFGGKKIPEQGLSLMDAEGDWFKRHEEGLVRGLAAKILA